MQDLEKRLGDLLQGSAKKGLKLSTTSCVLAELKGLGTEFQGESELRGFLRLYLPGRDHRSHELNRYSRCLFLTVLSKQKS